MSLPILCVTLLCSSSLSGLAQDKTIPIREGDLVAGSERVVRILEFDVDDSGITFVEAGTDGVPLQNTVLLRDGAILLRQGDPLAGGTFSTSFDFDANNVDHVAKAVTLGGFPAGSETALVFDDLLLAQRGTQIPGAPTGTRYGILFETKVNDANAVLAVGFIDSPSLAGTLEPALLRFDPDDAANPTSFTPRILAHEGDFDPVFGAPILGINSDPGSIGFNAAGDALFVVSSSIGAAIDTAIFLNDQLVVREGQVSPAGGLRYSDLRQARVGLNDFGETVFINGVISGTGTLRLLQKNDSVVALEGDVLAELAPDAIRDFGGPSGMFPTPGPPVRITNGGDVYWYANLEGDPALDQAFMRNDRVILRAGDALGTDVIESLRGFAYAFNVSDSGRFWLGGVTLSGGDEALVMADFGAVVPVLGCDTNTAELALADGLAVAGGALTLELDDAQAVGASPILYLSTAPAPLSPCGPMGGFGELLIGLGGGNPVLRLGGAPWTGSAVALNLSIPADPSLIDAVAYAQGLFVDAGGAEPLRATNALRFEVGAP